MMEGFYENVKNSLSLNPPAEVKRELAVALGYIQGACRGIQEITDVRKEHPDVFPVCLLSQASVLLFLLT
jgi:hypothetical protein